MIYIAEIQDRKFVKIGFTDNNTVLARLSELQTGNPYKINLITSIDGTLLQEQTIHNVLTEKFQQLHVPCPPNEWYPGKHPFMTKFIEELTISVSGAIAFCHNYHGNSKWMGGVQQPPKKRDQKTARQSLWERR